MSSNDLWNWQPHPKSKLIRVRYNAKNTVAFEFKHEPGMGAVSFGSKVGDWLLNTPHCPPGSSWALHGVDSINSSDGSSSTTLTFCKVESLT